MADNTTTPSGGWAPGYGDVFAERTKHALGRRVSLGVDTWGPVLMLNWGMPDPALLPAEATSEAIAAVLREEMPSPLEYDWPQGDPSLREVMARRLSLQNELPIEPAQITFNGGSSLSLENLCRAVLEPGDVVIAEDPSYPGTLHHYRLSDAEIIGVPGDTEGLRTGLLADLLERLQRDGRRVKVIHTIPDFQNPTGYTTSLRGMSQGRASNTMEFLQYRAMPSAMQKAMIRMKQEMIGQPHEIAMGPPLFQAWP